MRRKNKCEHVSSSLNWNVSYCDVSHGGITGDATWLPVTCLNNCLSLYVR